MVIFHNCSRRMTQRETCIIHIKDKFQLCGRMLSKNNFLNIPIILYNHQKKLYTTSIYDGHFMKLLLENVKLILSLLFVLSLQNIKWQINAANPYPTEVRRLTYTLSCSSFILPLGKAGHFQCRTVCKLSEQIIPPASIRTRFEVSSFSHSNLTGFGRNGIICFPL